MVYDKEGKRVRKGLKTLRVKELNLEGKKMEHFMIKEIREQPLRARELLRSLREEQLGVVEEIVGLIEDSKRVLFIASGSSYNASLVGVHLLRMVGKEAYAIIASEYESFNVYDKNTIVFAVSQSGETMDVISAIKDIKARLKRWLQ